jgi:NADH-quinone oxidoreductase subunit J
MTGQFISFFVLSLLTIGGAVFMISLTRVVHQVVALAFTFLSIAGLYILLEAEFVAITQILVYSGAISILMLFGIMLTRHNDEERTEQKGPFKFVAFLIVSAFFLLVFAGIQTMNITGEPANYSQGNNVLEIGILMFTKYVIPFETVSVLLLVALIGAIVIAKKEVNEND